MSRAPTFSAAPKGARLATSLIAAQLELRAPTKNRSVSVRSGRENYDFAYASLNSIIEQVLRPVLPAHGLWFLQYTQHGDGGHAMVTEIIHTSGEIRLCPVAMPDLPSNPHEAGSLISYFKRYALCAAFELVAEDDDDAQLFNQIHGLITEQQVQELEALVESPAELERLCRYTKVASLDALPAARFAVLAPLFRSGAPRDGKADRTALARMVCPALRQGDGISRRRHHRPHQDRLGRIPSQLCRQLVADGSRALLRRAFNRPPCDGATKPRPRLGMPIAPIAVSRLREVGFVDHPSLPFSGASPDGLVGDDGLVEIKCPNTATHIATLLGQSLPGKYVAQIQWQLACTGRAWCDFVSYDPKLPEGARLFVVRVHRDEPRIAELTAKVAVFLAEIEGTLGRINEISGMLLQCGEAA
ncbi:hypothetical protein FHS31_003061 [Sphingomonas vulcanisoli]|uniref:YqaJ viral recombinase domain-containing protein n=1 Tax=Sphingomonas vulcanisoli TaxID=1658060 RepID=A0ABX0TV74_9SPHN|nr:ERF family protein [Sphingomonas vulcanisoli]NIJ09429.1 hypothetical protein [Sphingomonas vulcanisoli]